MLLCVGACVRACTLVCLIGNPLHEMERAVVLIPFPAETSLAVLLPTRWDPLQSMLSTDQMRFAYVRALVDVTNRVGVDVRAIRHVAQGLVIGSIATRHIAPGLSRRR